MKNYIKKWLQNFLKEEKEVNKISSNPVLADSLPPVSDAIAFAEWIRIDYNPTHNDGEWWNRSNGADEKKYTTVELYEMFKAANFC